MLARPLYSEVAWQVYNAEIEEASHQKTMASRTRKCPAQACGVAAGVSIPAYKDDVIQKNCCSKRHPDDLRYDNRTPLRARINHFWSSWIKKYRAGR